MALASVSSQNRENQPQKNSVLLFIHTLILISTQVVSSKNTPIFACDIAKNHSLANFKFCDSSAGLAERVKDLVGRLSLEEKIGFLVNTGGSVDRLGIPSYEWWNEGVHGVGGNGSWGTKFSDLVPAATFYPQVILTAASWNTSLFEAIGKAISTEARAMHNVGLAGLTLFAPNINILRDPRWGRGQETPGEDPVLTSSYALAFVRGLQQIRDDDDMGRLKVAACCKHYVAYDLDNWKGIQREHFNAVVTKQDLEDTFRPPFKRCVTEGNAAGLLCSYNEINGKPSCDDPELASVVRGEWNLNGYIVSDYDSVDISFTRQNYTKTPEEAAALALLAGVDVNVGSFLKKYTGAAVKAGLVNESVVDRAISYNFATLMRLGFFNGDPRAQLYGELGPKDVCSEEHQKLALEAARQGIVLLKNSQASLPLSKDIKYLAVIGPYADAKSTMLGNYAGNACNYISPRDGIKEIVPVKYHHGCSESCDTRQIDEAKQLAASSEATILIMGDDLFYEQEYTDRIDLTLPGQQQLLITEVASAVKGPLILVIMSGGGMDVQFAKDNANITSILWIGYPGEAGGAAIADVIFGFHNPGGKLPMSWYPQSYTKIPMTNMNMRPDPSSGYPGRTYRFYTGPTVYNFGDGLSYTIFTQQLVQAPEFVSIPLEENHFCRLTECESIHVSENYCQNVAFEVRVRLKNEGKMRGSETVLLFSSPPHVHNAPQKQLLAFEKVFLEAETEGMVKFKVDVCKDLSVVDEVGSRKIAFGLHLLHVGSLEHNLNVGI